MALVFDSDHIMCFHMDAQWSGGWHRILSLTLTIWLSRVGFMTLICFNTTNQMGPHTYHYVKSFMGRVGYMPLGTLCNCIMALIDQTNTAMPFVNTAYPA